MPVKILDATMNKREEVSDGSAKASSSRRAFHVQSSAPMKFCSQPIPEDQSEGFSFQWITGWPSQDNLAGHCALLS